MHIDQNNSFPYKFYLGLLFFLFLFFIFTSYFLPLLSYQEARKAVIIQESFIKRSLIPSYNGEPYFTKPPLHTWISLIFYTIGCNNPKMKLFAMRLVSILSYLLIGYLIYLLHKKNILNTILCLLILFSSFRFLSFIYRLDLEPLFILFNLVSFYYLLKYLENPSSLRILLFYFFFACAFLVRGPLHFFLIPAYLFYAFFAKEKRILTLLLNPLGIIIFLVMIGPWFLYGYFKFGKEIFQEFLYIDLHDRLLLKKDPFHFYFKAYILNFSPFLLLILARITELKIFWKEKGTNLFKISFFSLLIPLLLLSFAGEKFDKYLLFLFPFSAIWITEILLYLYRPKWPLFIGTICIVLNSIVIASILFLNMKEINAKTKIFLEYLFKEKEQRLAFYQKAHPLVLYSFKKSFPVFNEKKEIEEALKKGYLILSPELIKELSYTASLPDPFKKGQFWYLYKNELFDEVPNLSLFKPFLSGECEAKPHLICNSLRSLLHIFL